MTFRMMPDPHEEIKARIEVSLKKGGFRLDRAIMQIEKELEKGENVIIDTTKMSKQHIQELKQAIEEKKLGERILWWP